MVKFHGEFEELKTVVASTGRSGDWKELGNGQRCFKAKTGEVTNWWPPKGTVQCQGRESEVFRIAIEAQLSAPAPVAHAPTPSARIFVVHGHDREARDQLELVLRRLGLELFILQNADGGSKTIIEAMEQNIYKDVDFGIVLLTPDDYGYAKHDIEADRKPRARQNVTLEMGTVMAALGRDRMAILQKGILERPSDADGILRIEFNDHVREIVSKLVQRLQASGYEISASMIGAASA